MSIRHLTKSILIAKEAGQKGVPEMGQLVNRFRSYTDSRTPAQEGYYKSKKLDRVYFFSFSAYS
jgi:hypothetical protein